MGRVRNGMLLSAAFFAALTFAPASAQEASDIRQEVRAAFAKADANDCKGALADVAVLVANPGFAQLAAAERVSVFDLGAQCALAARESDLAYVYVAEGAKFAQATPNLLRMQIGLGTRQDHLADAVSATTRLASNYPEALNDVPIQWFYQLEQKLRARNSDGDRTSLLAALSRDAYKSSEPGHNGDSFRYAYAAQLAAAGDRKSAASILAKLVDPAILIRASLDPRVRDMIPADFDARAAVERDLENLQRPAAGNTNSIGVILAASKRLRQLGRSQDALAMLQAARPAEQQNINWWWDAMAQNYSALGRYDDAVAAFRSGVVAGEGGRLNISQTLNLTAMQLHFGKFAEARQTAEAFEFEKADISPFGAMVFRLVRGCARFRTGDLAGAKADRDYALAHERDHPADLMQLLLCMGEIESAAAVMIRRLDDPEQRIDALLELSDYDPPLHRAPDPTDGPFDDMKLRPEVQKAIQRAGGIRRFRLQKNSI